METSRKYIPCQHKLLMMQGPTFTSIIFTKFVLDGNFAIYYHIICSIPHVIAEILPPKSYEYYICQCFTFNLFFILFYFFGLNLETLRRRSLRAVILNILKPYILNAAMPTPPPSVYVRAIYENYFFRLCKMYELHIVHSTPHICSLEICWMDQIFHVHKK